MHISAKSLGLEKLPTADRLALISEIWDGLSAEAGSLSLPPSKAQNLLGVLLKTTNFLTKRLARNLYSLS